jgi:hypothetical protein
LRGLQQFLRLVERTLPQVAEQVEPVMVYGHVFWNGRPAAVLAAMTAVAAATDAKLAPIAARSA